MVSVILDNLGAGESAEAIARDYRVEVEDVRAALMYASTLVAEQGHDAVTVLRSSVPITVYLTGVPAGPVAAVL
jgi:hypothetical protein